MTASHCEVPSEQARVRLGLYASFQHAPSTAVRHVVQEELAAIMIPMGMVVYWRAFEDSQTDQWWHQIATIHFKGHCDASNLRVHPPQARVFGETCLSGGKVIPYAVVYCDAIRASLASSLISMEPRNRTIVFGRAVSRVLAHELYHVLTRTTERRSGGLGAASFTPQSLVADEFRFHGRDLQRLRLAIASRPPAAAFEVGNPLCQSGEE